MKDRTITDAQRERVKHLRRQGYTLREISKLTNVSVAECSRTLNRAGIVGDSTRTVEAARSRFEQGQAARYDLIMDLYDDLESLRQRLNEPYDQWLNGPDGPVKVTLPEPPLSECVKIVEVMRKTVTEVNRLEEEFKDRSNLEGARNVLKELQEGLKAVAAIHGPSTDPNDYDSDYDIAKDPDEQRLE